MSNSAFAFVLKKLWRLGETKKANRYSHSGANPKLFEYWHHFIDEVHNKDNVSTWRRSRNPDQLEERLNERLEKDLSPIKRIDLDNLENSYDIRHFQNACLVGWLVRDQHGPIYQRTLMLPDSDALVSKDHDLLDWGVIEKFVDLLKTDFYPNCGKERLESCKCAITEIAVELRTRREARNNIPSWPISIEDFGSYIKEKRLRPINRYDLAADLLTQLLMSAIWGPGDYRYDFLMFDPRLVTKTGNPHSGSIPSDDFGLELTAHLKRVTYSSSVALPHEWIVCTNYDDIDLTPFNCIEFRRATDALNRLDEEPNGTQRILCIKEFYISEHHALLTLTGENTWTVCDCGSDRGTLIARPGRTKMISLEPNKPMELHANDVIILGQSDNPSRPLMNRTIAFLFHYVTVLL